MKDKHVLALCLCTLIVTIIMKVPFFSQCAIETPEDRTKKNLLRSPATAPVDIIGPKCVPIEADQFEKQVGRKASFFDPKIPDVKWPIVFSPMFQKYGWQAVSCESATARVMRLYSNNVKTYHSKCGPHDGSAPTSMIFGYPLDAPFSDKALFFKYIRELEKKQQKKQKSVLPLTFQLGDKTECQEFFASSDFTTQKWLSKPPKLNGHINFVSNFSQFREEYGKCENEEDSPLVQEIIEPPLWESEYLWSFRIYVMILNADPYAVVRRLGDIRRCSEPYAKRNDPDKAVRGRATRCNVYMAETHPLFGKEGGLSGTDVVFPFTKLSGEFGEKAWETVVGNIDESLQIMALAMKEHYLTNSEGVEDYNIAFYAVDGMINDRLEVKLLELNRSPQFHDNSYKALVGGSTCEDGADCIDLPRMALTAFAQFGLSKDEFSVEACAEEYPLLKRLI